MPRAAQAPTVFILGEPRSSWTTSIRHNVLSPPWGLLLYRGDVHCQERFCFYSSAGTHHTNTPIGTFTKRPLKLTPSAAPPCPVLHHRPDDAAHAGGLVLEGKRVIAIREKARRGGSIKAVSRQVDVSRNTVRRYLRQDLLAGVQKRPRTRRLTFRWREQLSSWVPDRGRWRAGKVQRRLAGHGVIVSVRTLRREVARIRRTRALEARRARNTVERQVDWEVGLVRRIAQQRRTPNHDELESELTFHLARLRRVRRSSAVKDWKAFLITALTRKATTWLKKQSHDSRHLSSLDAPIAEEDVAARPAHDLIGSTDMSPEDRWTLEQLRREVKERDGRVLDALVAENFHQGRAAQRLGVHRNSIRNALRRIERVLRRRGGS